MWMRHRSSYKKRGAVSLRRVPPYTLFQPYNPLGKVATSEGLEPPTSKVEAWRSIQLSYEAIVVREVGFEPTTNGLKGRYSNR